MKAQHAQRVYFEQVKRSVPIRAVLARYGIELKRTGKHLKGRCVIHKGTSASFVVDENTNLWRCFSPKCEGRGGSILELVSELEHIGIREAALLIAEWFAIKPSSDVQHRKPKETAMSGGRPSHKAFVVEDKEEGSDEKPFWTRVGSAWPHGDGKGLNIQIASGVSVAGRLVLREYTEQDAQEDDKKGSKFKKK